MSRGAVSSSCSPAQLLTCSAARQRRVRLAVVVDTFPRWSERFIARELNELLRRGIPLTVFALRKGRLPCGADPEFEPLLPCAEFLSRPLRAAVASLPRLARRPLKPELAAVKRELGSAGLLRAARAARLAQALRAGGFTHVHAHFANWPSTLAWLAAREAGLPFSFSVHAHDLFVEPQLLEEKTASAVAVFACHSRAHARLCAMPGAAAASALMYHGLPLESFPFKPGGSGGRPRPSGNAPPSLPAQLLAAGRFVPKKGFADLLAALDAPSLRNRSVRVTLVGDGPERPVLSREIRRRRLGSAVQIVPAQPPLRFRELLTSAALLVVPSRETPEGDCEGIPNVVLEAFALGTPVVGAAAGGIAEVLDDRTGWLVPPASPERLAGAIAAALGDPAAAEKTRAARRLVEARHDIRCAIAPLLRTIGGGL